jgi:Xaa-Pro aminopeptidase
MPNVLIVSDTIRSPELRHEVPVAVPDPLVYAELNGSRFAFVSSLEIPRLAALGGLELVSFEELGADELAERGIPWNEFDGEIALRACRHIGLRDAVTPNGFPLGIAEVLRAQGIVLTPDYRLFEERRRSKTEAELAGIRRAQKAAEAAVEAIRARLREGPPVSCEQLRLLATRAFSDAGATVPDLVIVSHGAQTAVGHEPGFGPIEPGEPIVVDLYPQDRQSGCYADMTRTFCLGTPPGELVEYHRLCLEALAAATAAIRPGMTGREVYGIAADVFEAAGYPTDRTKPKGSILEDGFFHALGHGVGLEVHEPPLLGRSGLEPLVPGDVLAVEPGCYRQGFGGCRLEDLVVVTEDACEVLTACPYDLAP